LKQSLAHFAFNSIALYSIGSAAHEYLSKPVRSILHGARDHLLESTSRFHFVAFFVSAGLFASLGSHVFSNSFAFRRAAAAIPSLGASGAIYAAFTYLACSNPEGRIQLIFLPFFSMPIKFGAFAMVGASRIPKGRAALISDKNQPPGIFASQVAVDAIGLVRGWRMFDHMAHLCGAAFGVIWYTWGARAFDELRAELEDEVEGEKA
jgi:rhomboid-like protein